jgi:hypothetical protein
VEYPVVAGQSSSVSVYLQHETPVNRQEFNLFIYQRHAMPVLLGWGIGSVFSGLLMLRSRSDWLRGLGSQFFSWGAVDSVIAVFALRNAEKKSRQFEQGEISKDEHIRQAGQFEQFIWLNTLLDIGYIVAGNAFANRYPDNRYRQGMGWGVIIQGAFLFIWDLFLVLIAQRKRRDP